MAEITPPGVRMSHDILVADDNSADISLIKAAWEDAAGAAEIHVVTNREKIFEFLQNQGGFEAAPSPDLLLLDLHLSGANGLDILADLRAKSEVSPVPVIVFSGSDYGVNVESAYQAGANAYVTKPASYDELLGVFETINDFWLSVAELPSEQSTD